MKHLLRFAKPHLGKISLLMLLYGLGSFCALFMPYVMSNIVELGIRNKDMQVIVSQGVALVLLAVGALVCSLITNVVRCKFTSQLAVTIRKEVFNKVNTLSFDQFSQIGTGSLITRTTDDVEWIEEALSNVPYVMISAPILFVGGVILSFRGDWLLPLILLGVSVVVLVVSTSITTKMEKYWRRGDEFTDVQNRVVRERLSGIRVVRAFDKEQYEHQRAKHATIQMCNSFVVANTVSGLISPIATLLLNLASVAIIYVGAVRLSNVDTLNAGNIIATIQYIALIANAVLMMSWTIAMIPRLKVSLNRVQGVLEMQNPREEASSGQTLDGSVRFDDVCFAYADSSVNVLSNVSLDIAQGEIVGVIGGTGSGKTTLVKTILNYYPILQGSRAFGGVNYDDLTPATVRDNVSIALQRSMIFEGTVADNIKMGNKNATDEQVAKVVEIAQLTDFVNSREEGFNYKLTQSGSNVSGGQKQRINIARAILKDASVYVFDDSFSALDYLTEANLRKALNKYLQGKTQIIVTQRAATAMRCDKVYVLEKGVVVGVGTHKQLLDSCKVYQEIYRSQMGGGLDE